MKTEKENENSACASGEEKCCCSGDVSADADDGSNGVSTVPGSMKAFDDLINSVSASGKVDKRVKELIVFALVVLQRCEPCVDSHYTKALGMGITKEALDEAAWCAIAMGGAPVRMFYSEYLKKHKDR